MTTPTPKQMTPAEYGAALAAHYTLTPEQIESAARILASVEPRDDEQPDVD